MNNELRYYGKLNSFLTSRVCDLMGKEDLRYQGTETEKEDTNSFNLCSVTLGAVLIRQGDDVCFIAVVFVVAEADNCVKVLHFQRLGFKIIQVLFESVPLNLQVTSGLFELAGYAGRLDAVANDTADSCRAALV